MSGLVVEILREEGALAALEPEWWRLFHRSSVATPFQSPAWLLAWWRCFRPGELCAISVGDDELVGLAPLYIEAGPGERRLMPIGVGVTDYLDLLVDDARRDEVLDAIGRKAALLNWDRWELPELAPGAAALSAGRWFRDAEPAGRQSACPILQWERECDPLAKVPPKARRQYRRAEAFAAARGGVQFKTMDGDVVAFMSILSELHRRRWESRGKPGVLANSRVREFHSQAIEALDRAGLARCHLLEIEGRPAAAFYGMSFRNRLYAYLGGFEPAFDHESPGAMAIGRVMRMAAREGLTQFDFLRGRERYKYHWGAQDVWNMHRISVRGGRG